MLRALLRAMDDGEAATPGELAGKLGVPEALIAQMVAQLVEQNYLAEAVLGTDRCTGCELNAACGEAGGMRLRLWTLTEKGRRAAFEE